MDAVAQTSAPATETPPVSEASKPAIKSLLQPMTYTLERLSGLVRWIWHFDLGAAVLVGEQTARFVKAAVEKGKEVEPSLTKPFKKAEDSVSGALGEVGARLKGIAKPVAPSEDKRLDAEVSELSARINELTQRIESLQARQDVGGPEEAVKTGR